MKDPIVEEIRRVREEHAARFNYDVDAIFEDLRKREKETGGALVSLQPRRVVKVGERPEKHLGSG